MHRGRCAAGTPASPCLQHAQDPFEVLTGAAPGTTTCVRADCGLREEGLRNGLLVVAERTVPVLRHLADEVTNVAEAQLPW